MYLKKRFKILIGNYFNKASATIIIDSQFDDLCLRNSNY
jgi:hypothetical protein